MGETNETRVKEITLTEETFFNKAMGSIIKDETLSKNGMGTLMGMVVVTIITKALFDEEPEKED